jgi:hypothetical protein
LVVVPHRALHLEYFPRGVLYVPRFPHTTLTKGGEGYHDFLGY